MAIEELDRDAIEWRAAARAAVDGVPCCSGRLTFHFPDLRVPHVVDVVAGVTFEGGVSPQYLRMRIETWAGDVSWIAEYFDDAGEAEESPGD